MKTIITLSIFILTVSINAQWVQQSSPANFGPTDIHMVNNTTGYISGAINGNGTVIKTTNGGMNWSSTSLSSPTNEMHALYFINENTGFTGGRSGALYKTTNGGASWSGLLPRMGTVIYSISFVDPNTGYLTGTFGRTRRTTNGGASWDTVDVPSNNVGVRVMFKNANTGFVNCGNLYRTTDMGESWQQINLSGGGVWDIWMLDAQTGFLLKSSPSELYKTSNGGANWQISGGGNITGPVENIFFVNSNTGFLYGGYFTPPNGPSSFLLKTTNAGGNWFQQNVPLASYLTSVYFTSADTGFTAGNAGIAATYNGGGPIGIQ
ncbi:MAG: hypothetical protein IAE90_00845 [Ignavibacteria bacterium]|nr:hypothetical protein [Ignavibacteria bacterium]